MNKLRSAMSVIYGYLKVFIYDSYRFVRYSGTSRKLTHPNSRGAFMTKYYHMVEKGLALPQPRPGFGTEAIKSLVAQVETATRDSICHSEVSLAADALDGYVRFNTERSTESPKNVTGLIEKLRASGVAASGSPIKELSHPAHQPDSYLEFLQSRVSVRDFEQSEVPKSILLNAVRAAQFAPCVCNRQASRVHFLTSPEKKSAALHFQKGNRGFGDSAPVIAIVTVDIAEMLEPIERYQHWIDGGLFAQNFLLAIHAQGYGACPLNWSAPISCEIGFRKLGYIPDSESIIMMVAIGPLKQNYKVARSARRPLADVARFLDEAENK